MMFLLDGEKLQMEFLGVRFWAHICTLEQDQDGPA